jgi:hypothetical protein
MTGTMMQSDTLVDIGGMAGEGLPVELVDGEVFFHVWAAFYAGTVGPEGVLEFFFVAPDFDVCKDSDSVIVSEIHAYLGE